MKNITKKGRSVLAAATSLAMLAGLGANINFRLSASAENSEDYNYYKSEYNSAQEVREAAIAKNREIAAEGAVLLKNDNYLPLKPESGQKLKVSIFGKNSAALAYFGYGSSDSLAFGGSEGWTRKSKTLYQAFEDNESGFEINPALKAFYQDRSLSGVGRLGGNIMAGPIGDDNYHSALDPYPMGLSTGETPYTSYTQEVINSYADYNDAAIVVLTRVRGEGTDLPKTSLKSWGGGKLDSARNADDHYLQLDAYEVKMMQEVMNNFDNVIVLVNASGPMEAGFLNNPNHYLYTDNGYTASSDQAVEKMNKIKAALTVGLPGTDGCMEIPRILTGAVNPSGHLADTWVYDMKQDPTWQNQGYNGSSSGNYYGTPYVHYDEDIYLGYRYYETRYYEEGKENLADGESWYSGQVQYPFGYGLSYTHFEWALESCETELEGSGLKKDGTITAKVKVTNTGETAGKEVVQLYYSAPYYGGGIAKSHVVLGDFAKTSLLQPGEEETVELKIAVEDMKSYDWNDANGNGFKGYELEHGNYRVIAASAAHDAAEKAINGGALTQTFAVTEDIRYETDAFSGATVSNLFDEVSGKGKTNDKNEFCGVRQYLSRDDFQGTFPTPAEDKKSGKAMQEWNYTISQEFDYGKPWYTEEMPEQAQTAGTAETNKIKIWHLRGRDYDDPLWDAFLNQLTVRELASQIENGFFGTRPIASVDKPSTYDDDGPLGKRNTPDTQWADNTTFAQTFNKQLAYEQGILHGEASLWGVNHAEGSNMMSAPAGSNASNFYNGAPVGRGGTYGLGINTHRSPFAGRNFEYFSEDGVLAGKLGAEVAKGSLEKGCYQIAKHFLLNDQETNRKEVQTWVSEQALREIYAKPFEIAIKEGGLNAVMAGFNSIGNKPCSQYWELLTGLLRNEWGFRGFVITDYQYLPVNMCIRAGCDTMMVNGQLNTPALDSASLTPTHVSAMRESAKSIFYTVVNTSGVQGYGGEPLDAIEYGGVNTLYTVEGVSNDLAVNTARITFTGDKNLEYSLDAQSTLPEGMSLDKDGNLTGAPSRAGEYTFTVNADEKTAGKGIAYPYKTASKTYNLKVYAKDEIPDTIIFEDDTVATIPVGFEFSQNIASAVAFDSQGRLMTDVNYSLAENSELPRGLTLKNGVISGTCTAPEGKYFFTVKAEAEGRQTVTLDFIVRVKKYTISYQAVELSALHVGESVYTSLATATNDDGLTIQYALKEGDKLPDGLTLSPRGILAGTPVRACVDREFTVIASASVAKPVETTYKITVYGLEIEDVVFDEVLAGKNYSFAISATPNDGNTVDEIVYSLKEGSSLPKGFRLSSDGKIRGAATEIGKQSFTVVVQAHGYEPVEASVTLNVYGVFEDGVTSDVDGVAMATPPVAVVEETNTVAIIVGITVPVAVLAAGAAVALILIKKNKNKEN